MGRKERMGQILVAINGRTYRLACADGQETRLEALAACVTAKVDQVAKDFGQVGEERLMLMAALLVADDLFELRALNPTPTLAAAVSLDAPSDQHRPDVELRSAHAHAPADVAQPSPSTASAPLAHTSVPLAKPKLPGKPPKAELA